MFTNYMKKGRDPGWIELFFDLSYVVLLGRMAHLLFHTHHGVLNAFDIITFLWIFDMLFIIWMYFTVYINIYGNNSNQQNFFSFIMMVCLMFIVVLLNQVEHTASYIAVTIGAMSLIMSVIYHKSRNVVPENKNYAIFKSKSQFVLALLTLLTLLMDTVNVIVYMTAIYAIEHIFDEVIITRGNAASPDGKHFVERIGIFMILLFGESFITLVYNLPEHITSSTYLVIALITASIFGLWINYYTYLEILSEIKYNRYSQILLTNMFVMLSLVILPTMIYHSLHQGLNLTWFNGMLVVFALIFYGSNGLTYFRIGNHSPYLSLTYSFLPPVIISTCIFISNSYSQSLIIFTAVHILTAIVAIINYKINFGKKKTLVKNRIS